MDKKPPLASIVIPAYNHAAYLDEAIRSVLAQDYPALELIVLDDGSIDGTRDVLQKYSGVFHWETHANMGQASTLNKGWQMAKGEILSYLSADDVLMPNAVSTSVRYLKANPDVILTYCDFNLIDPNSIAIRRVKAPEFCYKDMLVKLACPPGPGPFFRRQAFEAAGLWDSAFRQMPDYDYWLRLGLQGPFLRIPEVLAGFRVHEVSQTFSVADEKKAAEPILILTRFFENPQLSPDLATLKNQALSNAHLISAQLHLRAGRYGQGIACAQKAFSLDASSLFTVYAARLLLNALFNRVGHKLLRKIKGVLHKQQGNNSNVGCT